MAVSYAHPTPLDQLDLVELGSELNETIAAALPWLSAITNEQAGRACSPGRWCAKEVIGHLTDSAINNLDRIVRLETVLNIESEVRAHNYEQEAWVNFQRYADKDWIAVLGLWSALNQHIAWTIRHVSRHKLARICVFPDGEMTFGFVLEDYLAHHRHHLAILRDEAVSAVPGV